jgi:hypothetical protein
MNARPLPSIDPIEETVRSLPTWPDGAIFSLARAVVAELLRRQLPAPAALPVIEAAYLAVGSPIAL